MTTHGAASSRIGILFALPEEAAPFQRFLLRNPDLQKRVSVAVSGVGVKNSETAAKKLLEIPGKPFRLLIVCGFGGGLSPDVKPGSLMTANRVEYFGFYPLFQKSFQIEETLRDRLFRRFAFPDSQPRFEFCDFATTDHVLISQSEKQSFFDQHSCPVVEMETAGAVSVAEEKRIPWIATRVITDAATEDLPLDFNALSDENGNPDRSKIIRAVLRKPTAIPGLVRLGGRSSVGAKQLSEFLVILCQTFSA